MNIHQRAAGLVKSKTRLVGVFLLLVIFISGTADLIYIRGQVFTTYPDYIRDQISRQLDLFQQGYNSALAGYFSNALTTIENLASSNDTLKDFQQDNSNDLSLSFQHQEDYDEQFNTISAFLANGRLMAISTDVTKSTSVTTLSDTKPIIQEAVAKRRPTITNAFYSNAKRYVIGFAAPIFAPDNDYEGSVIGTTTISSLASRINFLSSYKFITTVVTDANGNVLTRSNKSLPTPMNISKSEPMIKKLMSTGGTHQNYETNYLGSKVFAEGSVVSYDDAGRVYIVSFIPKSYISSSVSGIQSNLVDATRALVAMIAALFLVIIVLILPKRKVDAKDPSDAGHNPHK